MGKSVHLSVPFHFRHHLCLLTLVTLRILEDLQKVAASDILHTRCARGGEEGEGGESRGMGEWGGEGGGGERPKALLVFL